MLSISVINAIGMSFSTIAAQYESSAFISLVAQFQIVWAFIADLAIFHEPFILFEIIGALIVFTFNLTAIFNQLFYQKK